MDTAQRRDWREGTRYSPAGIRGRLSRLEVMVPVTLRPLQSGDLDQLYAWECDPDSIRQAAFTRPDPEDRSAFDAHYARIRADRDVLLCAVLADDVLAGVVGSFTIDHERDVTYWVDPEQRGRGIATAALSALLELDMTRPIFARVAAHNTASAAVLAQSGFARVRTVRSFAHGVGQEIDEHVFRLDAAATSTR
ncbi:GNAT family N-acetyltransferase [Brachybacterium sp. YJGR34]|uniref:GNAT family N-acetyltransferase n=1 Tax=Brachybacterium sp. YJGR34 TaxID=2059911 RepID=UPI0018E5AB40|nr:GNAT family N-acetyltransferase [Brachybacterium sp. YJGR34]